MKEAILADTGPATITVKFLSVANLVPAFTAFDGSIDKLKHQTFRFSELKRHNEQPCLAGGPPRLISRGGRRPTLHSRVQSFPAKSVRKKEASGNHCT
jgi:hypothetical protein